MVYRGKSKVVPVLN